MSLALRDTRLFNVEQYERMAETGILHEDDHVELIEGEIIEIASMGQRHASRIDFLVNRVFSKLTDKFIVRVQNPVQINELSILEPDIVLLKLIDDYYGSRHPQPEDVLLLIEVSDSSLDYDRRVKLPLYAKAGIQEFWLINLIDNRTETYAAPRDGKYTFVKFVKPNETLSSVTMPDVQIDSSVLF